MTTFFYVADFSQKHNHFVKSGLSDDLTRRMDEEERSYKGKSKLLYVKTCETREEAHNYEDLSHILLRADKKFKFLRNDRFIYEYGNRPPIPIPISTDIKTDVRYI